MTLAPVWPKESALCQEGATEELTFGAIGQPAISTKQLPYCYLTINDAFTNLADVKVAGLDPGQSGYYAFEEEWTLSAPEDQEQALSAAFANEPVTWLAGPGSTSACYWDWAANETLTCPEGPTQIG